MNYWPGGVQATKVTNSGSFVISSANAHIVGIMFAGTGTNRAMIFAGLTASATATVSVSGAFSFPLAGAPLSGTIVANATVTGLTANPATYFPFPAYASGGITVNIPSTGDPSVTLYWSPAGGA